jgi:drug/metabolite transporter (DMT)-like permease
MSSRDVTPSASDASSRTDPLVLVAMAVSMLLWASAFVGIRAVTHDIDPGALALGRMAVGSLALGVLLASQGRARSRMSRRQLGLAVGSGLTWFAIYSVSLNTAERTVDAGTAAMLVGTGPIFVVTLAGLFLGEGWPRRLFAGCGVALVGAVTIGLATSEGNAAGSQVVGWGVILCVVAALAYAVGVTLQKPVLHHVSALQVTFIACLSGAVACLPFGPQLVSNLADAAPSSIAWLVYLGLFPTAVAFTTWSFALSRTRSGVLGSSTYVVPVLAIAMGWLLLGEVVPPMAVVGGVLCIGGVLVARSRGSWRPAFRRRPAEG